MKDPLYSTSYSKAKKSDDSPLVMWVKTENTSTPGRHLALSWATCNSRELMPAKYLEGFFFFNFLDKYEE